MITDIQAQWDKILDMCDQSYNQATKVSFIFPLRPYSYSEEDHILTVVAPNSTIRDTFVNRHERIITPAAQSVYDDPELSIKIYATTDLTPDGFVAADKDNDCPKSNLIEKYKFENFVKGKCNELAYSACSYVAESVGHINLENHSARAERNHYNPLFLYGGVGLGKTHLMHSVGNYIKHVDPSIKVLYTTAENLMNEFINSIRVGKNQEFRDKYRTIDLLLVDDIQFLADKEGTQDEFFHTFNALYNASKQIVISSDRPPSELVKFHERLLSRFDNGTMVDISQPDFETRAAILEKKVEMRDLKLPLEVIQYIAKNISSNIRALEGALNTVASYAKLANTTITLELAERALKDKMADNTKPEISVKYIQETVAKRFSTTREELCAKRRTAGITYARHIAMYLCRMLMDLTHVQIGQEFGKRDHTSVIYACNKIADEIEFDKELKTTVYDLEKLIQGE